MKYSGCVLSKRGSLPTLTILWCMWPSGVKSNTCKPPKEPSTTIDESKNYNIYVQYDLI